MDAERNSQFAVVSYNLHRCTGGDGVKAPERIARVLQSSGFDLAGVQELESGGTRNTASRQLDYLATRCNCTAISGPTIQDPDGDYGNGLLLRGTPTRIVRHDLSVPGREPRGALDVDFEIRGRTGRVIVTHLGLGLRERQVQVKKLMNIVRGRECSPTLLLGDFNEWVPWSLSRRRLRAHFGPIPTPRTFPAWLPLLALDHIWVRPPSLLERLSPLTPPEARVASDHLPLRATVKFAD